MAANLSDQANRLYWASADTVEEVAGRLGISRHTLYAAVRPVPAGRSCAVCGESLVYSNRSHRASGLATCSGCGLEVHLEPASQEEEEQGGALEVVFTPAEPRSRSMETGGARDLLDTLPPRRVAAVAGALTLGALFGAVAVRAAGRYA